VGRRAVGPRAVERPGLGNGRGCACCGQRSGPGPCPNRWCHRADRGWSVVHGVGTYQGVLRQAVMAFKYHDEVDRAAELGGMLARYVAGNATWFEEYDVMTGVPSYGGAGRRRDWDPVGRLVEEMAGPLGRSWELRTDLVAKVAETPAMSGRSRWERTRIAEGPLRRALRPGTVDLSGARVLVVDDVFTEGSTLREVARVLRRSGAEEVAGLVLARPAWAAT
jgi:predicted amidophosphoribosyltransferase